MMEEQKREKKGTLNLQDSSLFCEVNLFYGNVWMKMVISHERGWVAKGDVSLNA